MTADRDPHRARQFVILGAKLALLLVAFWLISRQVSWWDRVEMQGGDAYIGTIVDDPPSGEAVEFETRDGRDVTLPADAISEKILGLRSTFSRLDLGLYGLGMAMILGMYMLGIWRWKILLGAQGIHATYWRAFRLTFVGFFFNNFLVGMTGGDVVKAVIIARDSPGRRSEAVSTVIVDRIIGLAVLAMMSAVCIAFNFDEFREQGYVVFAVLAACGVAFVCFFSRRVRRTLRISNILKALPGSAILQKLDHAFYLYRSSPRALAAAFVLSIFAHFCNIGSVYAFGRGVGIPAEVADLVTYFATVPIIFIVASIPVTPAGWGVREVFFIKVFTAVGVPAAYTSHLLVLSVLTGFSVLAWSLLGGVFFVWGRRHGDIRSEVVAEAAASETT